MVPPDTDRAVPEAVVAAVNVYVLRMLPFDKTNAAPPVLLLNDFAMHPRTKALPLLTVKDVPFVTDDPLQYHDAVGIVEAPT